MDDVEQKSSQTMRNMTTLTFGPHQESKWTREVGYWGTG